MMRPDLRAVACIVLTDRPSGRTRIAGNAMPRRQERVITKRTVDALSVEHRDAVFWDRDLPASASGSIPRPKEIRRPVARPRRVEEGDAWTARETHRRRGAAPGGGGHRPHQAGRGPDSPSAGARADDGRSRRALHARLRALALQGVERGGLPAGARQPHPAGAGRDACGRGRARAGDGTALRDARRAPCGERGAEDRGQDAVAGRRMGPAGARAEPMPGGAQVPHAPARAVPDRRGVLPARPGGR